MYRSWEGAWPSGQSCRCAAPRFGDHENADDVEPWDPIEWRGEDGNDILICGNVVVIWCRR